MHNVKESEVAFAAREIIKRATAALLQPQQQEDPFADLYEDEGEDEDECKACKPNNLFCTFIMHYH